MTRVRIEWSLVSVFIVLATLVCGPAFPAWSQTTSMGTITGLVTDPTNAVVPDATVTVKDTKTSEVRTTATNNAGRYVFVNLPPGTYGITIAKTGFEKISISNDVVAIGEVSTNNAVLKIGAETQTVEVASSGVELPT